MTRKLLLVIFNFSTMALTGIALGIFIWAILTH